MQPWIKILKVEQTSVVCLNNALDDDIIFSQLCFKAHLRVNLAKLVPWNLKVAVVYRQHWFPSCVLVNREFPSSHEISLISTIANTLGTSDVSWLNIH